MLIYKNVHTSKDTQDVPGIADFTALTIASKIERFSDPEKLKSYAVLVPSVRNSADVVHHPTMLCDHATMGFSRINPLSRDVCTKK
ncbi:MAG: Transposase [Cenarchaeum symbiont of Oopsacas minuta]|nr:Transposase [Cenarchaeum symbiont of Oopsacas minuta]